MLKLKNKKAVGYTKQTVKWEIIPFLSVTTLNANKLNVAVKR